MKPCHCAVGLGGTPLYCDTDCQKTGLILGNVYPSEVDFIPADNPSIRLRGLMIDNTTMIVLPEPTRKGWICPKCDNAVSPDEKTCPYCKQKPKKENADGERTHITETD